MWHTASIDRYNALLPSSPYWPATRPRVAQSSFMNTMRASMRTTKVTRSGFLCSSLLGSWLLCFGWRNLPCRGSLAGCSGLLEGSSGGLLHGLLLGGGGGLLGRGFLGGSLLCDGLLGSSLLNVRTCESGGG